eukprot:5990421-Amphidinium_carterae.1
MGAGARVDGWFGGRFAKTRGLYSRLWCDWEIYYAARVGLPIHFTHRASYDYLFGDESPTTASSRNAHCSNPEDDACPSHLQATASYEVGVKKSIEHGLARSVWAFIATVVLVVWHSCRLFDLLCT